MFRWHVHVHRTRCVIWGKSLYKGKLWSRPSVNTWPDLNRLAPSLYCALLMACLVFVGNYPKTAAHVILCQAGCFCRRTWLLGSAGHPEGTAKQPEATDWGLLLRALWVAARVVRWGAYRRQEGAPQRKVPQVQRCGCALWCPEMHSDHRITAGVAAQQRPGKPLTLQTLTFPARLVARLVTGLASAQSSPASSPRCTDLPDSFGHRCIGKHVVRDLYRYLA